MTDHITNSVKIIMVITIIVHHILSFSIRNRLNLLNFHHPFSTSFINSIVRDCFRYFNSSQMYIYKKKSKPPFFLFHEPLTRKDFHLEKGQQEKKSNHWSTTRSSKRLPLLLKDEASKKQSRDLELQPEKNYICTSMLTKPHSALNSVRAIAISGLWLGSL